MQLSCNCRFVLANDCGQWHSIAIQYDNRMDMIRHNYPFIQSDTAKMLRNPR